MRRLSFTLTPATLAPAKLEIGGTFDLPKFENLEGYALLCLV